MLSQLNAIAFTVEDVADDGEASGAGDVLEDLGELDIHLQEGGLNVAGVIGAGFDEGGAMAQVAAQGGDIGIGAKGSGKQAKSVEGLNPLGIRDIGLTPSDLFGVHGIGEKDGEAACFEQLEDGNPVKTCGFHGNMGDAALLEPIREACRSR